jgi:AraC family transcriptional regulator
MLPVAKALWYIETHSDGVLTLDDISQAAGVSRFHLARAFGYATGLSVMAYLRGRRLSQAAKSLAGGAPDILAVALDAGYSSHEAFTRAFREQFGITPEALRAQGTPNHLNLTEPIRMETNQIALAPPRTEVFGPLLIAGLSERYTDSTSAGIPAQWQRFAPYIGHIPAQVGSVAYGVVCNTDDQGNTEYICGVEVSGFSQLPAEFARLRLPARKYAVFFHAAHISTIRATWSVIWNQRSEIRIADAPSFERYPESFNPMTGMGGVEIWVPLEHS